MPIRYETGNILEADVEAIVIPVNTIGVAGAGLALQAKSAFPVANEKYEQWCNTGLARIGSCEVVDFHFGHPRYIIYLPTKKHWNEPSKLEYVESGLMALVFAINENSIKSIAIPRLGCGLGGLNWDDVHRLIVRFLNTLTIDVVIYGEPIDLEKWR